MPAPARQTCPELAEGDLDFAQRIILVRDGKGAKDRVTMLPESLVSPLQDHLRIVKRTHEEDLAKGYGAVYLPHALERKYPNAEREWIRNVKTTVIYTHACTEQSERILNRGSLTVRSPLDRS
jgi:hypothetical protein